MNERSLPLASLPRIVLAGQFTLTDRDFATLHCGRSHALHLHGYAGAMTLAGALVTLAPGDLTLSPAGLLSAYHLTKPGRHWCIHFETAPDGGGHQPLALHLTGCAGLRERFANISALLATASDEIGFIAARLAAQELLLAVARRTRPLPADDAPARAAQFIDDHFAEPIGVPAIAAWAGRSPAYLARVFRQRFGTTMAHRLLQRRAEHARFLLESTDLPIWRVGERCGVPDAQHFNKLVRAVLGRSPSAVRGAARGARIDPDR